jgi:hypothetical protein
MKGTHHLADLYFLGPFELKLKLKQKSSEHKKVYTVANRRLASHTSLCRYLTDFVEAMKKLKNASFWLL